MLKIKHSKIEITCVLVFSGVYWVKTDSGPAETVCDMTSGGWTLIGEDGRYADSKHHSWLRQNVNAESLASGTDITPGQYACIGAVEMAVNHVTKVGYKYGLS